MVGRGLIGLGYRAQIVCHTNGVARFRQDRLRAKWQARSNVRISEQARMVRFNRRITGSGELPAASHQFERPLFAVGSFPAA
jgi:hypothetical protein